MKGKVLEKTNYSDIPYNDFNNLLTEALYYQCNITFDSEFLDDSLKELFNIKDITLQFKEENNYNDEFDIAIYCKRKNKRNWQYVDNITRELYERRFENGKIKRN